MKKEIKILLIYISVLLLVNLVDYLCQIDEFSFAFGVSVWLIIDFLCEKFMKN